MNLQALLFRKQSEEIPDTILENIIWWVGRLTKIEEAYGKTLQPTRCYSSIQEQIEIYQHLNASRALRGLPALKCPLKSMHLLGKAVDIYDPNGALKAFIDGHPELFEDLCFEDWPYTADWVHMQSQPPASGLKKFRPY